MNITQEKIDNLNAVIKIQLSESDYQKNVDKVLKDYRNKASVPGFRKGHVPMGMVKKMVGVNAMVDEINKVLSESLQKYLAEEKLDVLGNPLPKLDEQEKIDWENQKDFEFRYDVGLAPSFEVELSDKFKFDQYIIKVAKADIDKYVEDLSRRYGKMTNPEVADADDMLFGKFEELENGQVKEGGITNSSVVIIKSVTDSSLQKSLVGAKAGSVIELDPKKVSEHESDVAAALGVKPNELKNINNKFRYTVEKINKILPAEVNQDLFDKVFGPNNVKSVEEFRGKIEEQMSQGLVVDSDRKLKTDIQDELLSKLSLQLPDSFLKRWIASSNENPVTPEQIEQEYDQYAKELKWQLVENKIIKKYDIKVSFEDVVEHTKGLLKQQLASMGLPSDDDKDLTETANRVLQNQEEARNIYMMMYDMKMMKLFKSIFKLNKKEISYEDFAKIAYGKK
ncbi:MAG: trigger factor [Flavobacteriales bacterium]|nr:trigger factor [Flavobacteriales bacterium]